ncbi:cation diffusion facilitator family transporter [Natronospora cellulosivora (SeqCode)]
MRRVRSDAPDSGNAKLYRKAIMIAIIGNIFLTVIKVLLAWYTGSSAVFSDAANSLTDILYSFMMGLGLYLAQRPADETHPQGHKLFEPLVGLFIAVAIGAAGVVAVWQSIQHFLGRGEQVALGWPTVVLVIAGLTKYIMYRMVSQVAEKVHSPAIEATARDNLADILISSSALIGVWGSRFIHPYFDPIAGLFVAIWIFRTTAEIIRENFGYLTGKGAPLELTEEIRKTACSISEVDNVNQIVAEYIGPQLRVDMHINVDGDISLERAHDIGEEVREEVEKIKEVELVFVHIEPTEHGEASVCKDRNRKK